MNTFSVASKPPCRRFFLSPLYNARTINKVGLSTITSSVKGFCSLSLAPASSASCSLNSILAHAFASATTLSIHLVCPSAHEILVSHDMPCAGNRCHRHLRPGRKYFISGKAEIDPPESRRRNSFLIGGTVRLPVTVMMNGNGLVHRGRHRGTKVLFSYSGRVRIGERARKARQAMRIIDIVRQTQALRLSYSPWSVMRQGRFPIWGIEFFD